MLWKKKPTPEEQAMAEACLHLRMVMAGRENYSASVTQVDLGHARLLLERLEVFGFELTKVERVSGGNIASPVAPTPTGKQNALSQLLEGRVRF